MNVFLAQKTFEDSNQASLVPSFNGMMVYHISECYYFFGRYSGAYHSPVESPQRRFPGLKETLHNSIVDF